MIDDPQWVLVWSTMALAIVTFILAFVALFQDQLRERMRSPRLDVTIEMSPPDCHMIVVAVSGVTANALYLRLRVWNRGDIPAKDVEVFAAQLRRRDPSQKWQVAGTFLPMNLLWSHMGKMTHLPMLSPGTFKHCDFAHVIDPAKRPTTIEDNPNLNLTSNQTSMRFDVMVYPNHKGDIVEPGNYELDLVLAGSNCRPTHHVAVIELTGTWHSNEVHMLGSGVGVTIRRA